jgi:hypothetical protein
MPNRILREGIVTSERVNSLTFGAEVFYRRLMSIVDDYGRCTAHAELLLGTCYALQLRRVNAENIEQWIAECQEANLLLVYEVSKKRYLEIIDFKQQIRSKNSKCPAPADGLLITCVADAKQVPANAHLVGVGVGVGDVYGVGDGGVGGKPQRLPDSDEQLSDRKDPPPSDPPAQPVHQSRAVQIAVYLRANGIDGANSTNPHIDAWAQNPRVTDELLETAVGMVRERKPTRPGPNYLQPIIAELLDPPPARENRGKRAEDWERDDNAAVRKGSELGLYMRTHERIETYRERIRVELRDRQQRAGAHP